MSMIEKKNNWLLWVLLVLLPPIGVIYLWIKKKEFTVKKKTLLTAIFTLWFIICIAINGNSTSSEQPASAELPVTETLAETKAETESAKITSTPSAETKSNDTSSYNTSNAAETESTTTVADSSAPLESKAADLSTGQKNALSKAAAYLDYSAFSYSGLIQQLEYEQFSTEDATYAADNCGADWNEQAAIKAQQYLDYSSFSRGSLIDQLKYDGFTQSQAEHGATAVGY